MLGSQFLEKAIKRIDQIDRQSLARWVADLIEREKLLTQLLNLTSQGMIVANQQGKIFIANQTAGRLVGTSHELNTNQTIEKMVEDRELKTLIMKTLKENRGFFQKEIEILIPRNIKLYLSIQLLITNTTSDELKKRLFVIFITEITKNTDANHESQHMERLSSLLSLASGIAHEIGNPLNSIGVHLTLLRQDISKLPERQKKRLKRSIDVVTEETKRLDAIVRNFLKATRRKQLHLQLTDIRDIIKEVILLFEPEFKLNHIKVTTRFDPNMPTFFLDGERINQVFVNLIKNSIQAIQKDGRIAIQTSHQKNICEIIISDTGGGINPDILQKIFDAYYTTKEEGSGLGLVIAYQIIREHSGRIEVTSNPGKGTTFRILLPIRKENLRLPGPKPTENHHEQFI